MSAQFRGYVILSIGLVGAVGQLSARLDFGPGVVAAAAIVLFGVGILLFPPRLPRPRPPERVLPVSHVSAHEVTQVNSKVAGFSLMSVGVVGIVLAFGLSCESLEQCRLIAGWPIRSVFLRGVIPALGGVQTSIVVTIALATVLIGVGMLIFGKSDRQTT